MIYPKAGENNGERRQLARWERNAIMRWNDEQWARAMYGDVYQQESREDSLDNDELSAWEAAFMDGYELAV